MAGTIGIKIANGDFYPIMMEEDSTVKKRLVLTTVHDSQESVQIDLHRSISESMQDAQYIGSLVVENIKPRPRGEPSIEMIISSNEDGTITADARDLDARAGIEHYTLNVSLKTVHSESQRGQYPDFNIENASQTPVDLYDRNEPEIEDDHQFPWFMMICATVFVIIAIALLWFFFLGGRDILPFFRERPAYEQTEPLTPPPPVVEHVQPVEPPPPPPPPAEPEPVQVIPSAEPPPVETAAPVEPPVIAAPVTPPPVRPQTVVRKRPPAPVASYRVPAVIPKNGVAYRIRWGDTLWDISEAFYRNPWLYPRIARYNNISNPDLIISGRTIRVPPRN